MTDNKNTPSAWNFAYEFRPIHYFARVCGQMPFTITYHTKGGIVGVKMEKWDFIWIAITISIQISFICLAVEMLKSTSDPNAHTYNLYFGNLIVWFFILLFGICMMAIDVCNRFRFSRILNKFIIFDEGVCKSKWSEKWFQNQHSDMCVFLIGLPHLDDSFRNRFRLQSCKSAHLVGLCSANNHKRTHRPDIVCIDVRLLHGQILRTQYCQI